RTRDDEVGGLVVVAAGALRPLAVVIVTAEVEVDLAAQRLVHDLLDRHPGDQRQKRNSLVSAGVAVGAVRVVGVVGERDLPGRVARRDRLVEPALLGPGLVVPHQPGGVHDEEVDVGVLVDHVPLVGHRPLVGVLGVLDLVGQLPPGVAQRAVIVVAHRDPKRHRQIGVGHLELGLELIVVDRGDAVVVEVVAEVEHELAATLVGADLLDRCGDVVPAGVALPGVAAGDDADQLVAGARRVAVTLFAVAVAVARLPPAVAVARLAVSVAVAAVAVAVASIAVSVALGLGLVALRRA